MKNQHRAEMEIAPAAAANDLEIEEKESYLQVYVTGEVKAPGVYKLQEGARVYEAVEMAGGVLATADLRRLDMARRLQDEETVFVPAVGEAPASSYFEPDKVNINTASVSELADKLTGIGPGLSQRIVDYRDAYGPFKKIEDIKNVSGIGEKRFQDIKENITVR